MRKELLELLKTGPCLTADIYQVLGAHYSRKTISNCLYSAKCRKLIDCNEKGEYFLVVEKETTSIEIGDAIIDMVNRLRSRNKELEDKLIDYEAALHTTRVLQDRVAQLTEQANNLKTMRIS